MVVCMSVQKLGLVLGQNLAFCRKKGLNVNFNFSNPKGIHWMVRGGSTGGEGAMPPPPDGCWPKIKTPNRSKVGFISFRMHQNSKIEKLSGEGAQPPSQTPLPMGGEHPLPTPHSTSTAYRRTRLQVQDGRTEEELERRR